MNRVAHSWSFTVVRLFRPRFLTDRVDQRADSCDGDSDLVAVAEPKGIRWHDSCAGEKEAAVRKRVVAEKKMNERFGLALQRFERS